jgi:WD40 repeat protein
MLYKAFISYSHAADGKLAPTVQTALQQFAKPFYYLRAIRVFRDESSLALTPKLWPTIQSALGDSEYFILLAAPKAAQSQWVQDEVAEWLRIHGGSLDKFLIVLTDGDAVWDRAANDFDWDITNSLPAALRGRFGVEPFFLDLRWARNAAQLSSRNPQFLQGIAKLSMPLRGMQLDEVIGEDVRQHRITRAVIWIVALLLGALVLATSGAAYYATGQRNEAVRQAKVALAGQLAAQAEVAYSQHGDLLERGVLLAVKSARSAERLSLDTNLALRHGLDLLPMAIAEVPQEADMYNLAVSPDGAYAATASGNNVQIWEVATGRIVSRLSHADTVFGLAFTPDGTRLVTADGDLRIWHAKNWQLEAEIIDPETWVSEVAVSPDGKLLATVSRDTATIWELAKRLKLFTVVHDNELPSGFNEPRNKSINKLVFGPDSRSFATASDDHTARVWDASTGRQIAKVMHDDQVSDVAYSFDGQLIATASSDRSARIASVESGEELVRLEHKGPVKAVAFSPDGTYLATGAGEMFGGINVGNRTESFDYKDNAAHLWDVASGNEVMRFPHLDAVWTLAFSPEGKYLATGSFDRTARLWDIASGQEVTRMVHPSMVTSLAFTPDGQHLITGVQSAHDDRPTTSAMVWSTTDARQAGLFANDTDESVYDVAFDPVGTYVATATSGIAAKLFDRASGKEEDRVFHTGGANAVAFSPDGRYLAVGFRNDQIDPATQMQGSTENVTTLLVKKSPEGLIPPFEPWAALTHGSQVLQLAFTHDGGYLATRGEDSTVRVWEVATKREIRRLKHGARVEALAFSPDGMLLATVAKSTVTLWDAVSWEQKGQLTFGRAVAAIAFSPDGRLLATALQGGKVRLSNRWDDLFWENDRIGPPAAMVFDPKGRYVAVRCDDNAVWLLDAQNGTEIARLRHEGRVISIALSPDGDFVATAGQDNTIRIWQASDGREIMRFPNDDNDASYVGFDPSGRFLLVGGKKGVAELLWRPGDMAAEACKRLRASCD